MHSKTYCADEHEKLLISKLWREVVTESDLTDLEMIYEGASIFIHSCILLTSCPHLKPILVDAAARCDNFSRLKFDIKSFLSFDSNKSEKNPKHLLQLRDFKISPGNLKSVMMFFYLGLINLTSENICQVEHLGLLLQVPVLLDYCAQFKADSVIYRDQLPRHDDVSQRSQSKVVVFVSSTPLKQLRGSTLDGNNVEETNLTGETLESKDISQEGDGGCEDTDREGSLHLDAPCDDVPCDDVPCDDVSCDDVPCDDVSLQLNKKKPRKTETFKCPLCPRTFKQLAMMTKHTQRHKDDSNSTFQCTYCDKIFYDPVTLRRHAASHTKKRFKCDLCDKRYTSEMGLKVHKKSSHKHVRNYTCSECRKSFSQKAHLQEHRRVHTQEKQHVCSFCGAGLCSKVNLRRHERSHTGERPFRCATCTKSFAVQQDLDRHNKLLHKHCILTCEVCGITLQSRHRMNQHARLHTNQRQHQCSFCPMRFSHVMWLRRHEEQHEVEGNQIFQAPDDLMIYNSSMMPLPTLSDVTIHRAFAELS